MNTKDEKLVHSTKTRRSESGRIGRSGSPDGWYRAEQNNQDGKAVLKAIRPGMSARQVTDIILNNKVNYLSPEDRNKLAKAVVQNNPSVFQDGKVKEGFDPSKLDIPSIDYIKKNYVGSSSGMRTTKGTREATGSYSGSTGKHTVESNVTSRTGRYAKKVDGKWRYYAKDGTELKPDVVLTNKYGKYDADLANKTKG